MVVEMQLGFFFNGYSTDHTSAISGDTIEDGITINITGVGPIGFNSRDQIDILFKSGWNIKQIGIVKQFVPDGIHSEWKVIARNDG